MRNHIYSTNYFLSFFFKHSTLCNYNSKTITHSRHSGFDRKSKKKSPFGKMNVLKKLPRQQICHKDQLFTVNASASIYPHYILEL